MKAEEPRGKKGSVTRKPRHVAHRARNTPRIECMFPHSALAAIGKIQKQLTSNQRSSRQRLNHSATRNHRRQPRRSALNFFPARKKSSRRRNDPRPRIFQQEDRFPIGPIKTVRAGIVLARSAVRDVGQNTIYGATVVGRVPIAGRFFSRKVQRSGGKRLRSEVPNGKRVTAPRTVRAGASPRRERTRGP